MGSINSLCQIPDLFLQADSLFDRMPCVAAVLFLQPLAQQQVGRAVEQGIGGAGGVGLCQTRSGCEASGKQAGRGKQTSGSEQEAVAQGVFHSKS